MSCYLNCAADTSVTIPNHVDNNGITYYDIQVCVGPTISWTVQHRYREFVDLNDKLISGHSISKDLLPPKKVIGNKGFAFLEQRQKQLQIYLQTILKILQFAMSRELVEFLELNKYDIIYLLQDMAQLFFLQGDELLMLSVPSNSYDFSALELFAITERLKLPCPTSDSVKKMYDFSHVVDFCSQLDRITVQPRKKIGITDPSSSIIEQNTSIGTSNIVPGNLMFDLNAFRNLKSLQINGISPENISEADSIRSTLTQLTVHGTRMTQLNQIILCDCIHKSDNLDATKIWKSLQSANFAKNEITSIDCSVQLLPKLFHLNLDRNRIKTISFLNRLPFLSSLSLCENQISECIDCHLELGNIKVLNLSQNKIRSLNGFRKMYSLVTLNVSCNHIEAIDEVDAIAGLPCLEELILTGNPVAGAVDYRPRVLSRFGDRCSELYLDNEKAGPNEIDMALVLAALRLSESTPKLNFVSNR